MVAFDLKQKVVGAVGTIHKLDEKGYERFVEELRDRLSRYDSPASHDSLLGFLKEHKVHDESVERAIGQLDLFLTEKHL